MVDGTQTKLQLSNEEGMQEFLIVDNETEAEHEITVFKRMDACHYFTFEGILLHAGGELLAPPVIESRDGFETKRRMEFYGDSVTAGEVSEAIEYVGKEDPEHQGEFSNAYYSYAAMTARKLGEMCGKKAFRTTGKRFMILTGSLEEYEYYLTQLKRMFDGNSKLNVNNKIITMPVIISGIMNAQKLGDSGLILEYAEYLEALSAKNGLTEVIQDDYQTMNGFLYNKRVEQYLHKAITEDLFEIYYQPVYSTRKKCFITLEALSRLQHPELGWIAPDVFIQIAEKNHMIEQITDLQFSRVCRFLGENRYLMRHLLNVKVNLSSLDLMRNDCSRHFIRIMDAYKIPHNWIQFEITETVATECNAGLRRVAEEFTDAGIGLCLDDFGSGYANLNTVMRLPFSVIKVDRSLLFDICRDEKRAIFYESVVETFHKMNYHIVSEGVETQEEMEQISSWGVEMIQGYYFSKPLPEKELLELLKKQDNIER